MENRTANAPPRSQQTRSPITLWDGLSKGTLNNILNLLERGKKVVVYLSPQRACHTLRQISDIPPLLADCPRDAMEEFEAKIGLSDNRLESLSGNLKGFWSIRINQQWRIVFRWKDGNATDVEITDYH